MAGSSSITSKTGMVRPPEVKRCTMGSPLVASHRQTQDKAGAAVRRVGDPQIAAVALGNASGHDQAQAETGRFAADKRLKQPRQKRRSNARTSITHPQLDLTVHRSTEADVQAAALR